MGKDGELGKEKGLGVGGGMIGESELKIRMWVMMLIMWVIIVFGKWGKLGWGVMKK